MFVRERTQFTILATLNHAKARVQPSVRWPRGRGRRPHYLWGFFQNGKMVWENRKNEGKLSGPSYGPLVGSAGWNALHVGEVEVSCLGE
jgi:hypothetical protein